MLGLLGKINLAKINATPEAPPVNSLEPWIKAFMDMVYKAAEQTTPNNVFDNFIKKAFLLSLILLGPFF